MAAPTARRGRRPQRDGRAHAKAGTHGRAHACRRSQGSERLKRGWRHAADPRFPPRGSRGEARWLLSAPQPRPRVGQFPARAPLCTLDTGGPTSDTATHRHPAGAVLGSGHLPSHLSGTCQSRREKCGERGEGAACAGGQAGVLPARRGKRPLRGQPSRAAPGPGTRGFARGPGVRGGRGAQPAALRGSWGPAPESHTLPSPNFRLSLPKSFLQGCCTHTPPPLHTHPATPGS